MMVGRVLRSACARFRCLIAGQLLTLMPKNTISYCPRSWKGWKGRRGTCLRSSFVGLLPRPSIFPKLSILLEWLEKEIWFGVGYGGVGRVLELVCCTSSGGMGCAEKSTRRVCK